MKRAILWLTAYALAVLSAVWAARYGVKAADTWVDTWIRGAALGAVAIFGVHSFAWAHRSWRSGGYTAAFLTALAGILCFVVAIAGGVGNLALTTETNTGARAASIAAVRDDTAEKTRLEADLANLPKHRPAAAVEAMLATSRAHQRYMSSKGCEPAHITLEETRAHCAGFRRLEAELATAKAADALEDRIGALHKRILKAGPQKQDADPHGSMLSRITFGRIDAQTASSWYAFGVALALELAAIAAMLAYEVTTRELSPAAKGAASANGRAPAEPGAVEPPWPDMPRAPDRRPAAPVEESDIGNVSKFLVARLEAVEGTEFARDDVYPIYLDWCSEEGRTPLPPDRFEKQFDEICVRTGIKTRTVEDKVYVVDVSLSA